MILFKLFAIQFIERAEFVKRHSLSALSTIFMFHTFDYIQYHQRIFFGCLCCAVSCVCVCLCSMCRDKPKLIVAAGREIVPAQINCAPRYLNYDIIKLNAICCFCSVYVPFKGDAAIMCWPNAFLYLYLCFFHFA